MKIKSFYGTTCLLLEVLQNFKECIKLGFFTCSVLITYTIVFFVKSKVSFIYDSSSVPPHPPPFDFGLNPPPMCTMDAHIWLPNDTPTRNPPTSQKILRN